MNNQQTEIQGENLEKNVNPAIGRSDDASVIPLYHPKTINQTFKLIRAGNEGGSASVVRTVFRGIVIEESAE